MVDAMAHRYGMLPSEILAKATTQDLYIYDTVMSYRDYIHEKERRKENNANNQPAPASVDLTQQLEQWRASRG